MAKKKPVKNVDPTAAASGVPDPLARLIPPPNGVTVRFYRTGHGDCFLLAFAGKDPKRPAYVLIDCGYKPGSPKFIDTTIKEITASIGAATGGEIDVAIITHEHQDHVNGITAANFKNIKIAENWLAWTEDPRDPLANQLRDQFKDKLLGLIAARNRLAAAGDDEQAEHLDEFLAFELGGDDEGNPFSIADAQQLLGAAAKDPLDSMNKKSMKVFKDLAGGTPKFLKPHDEIYSVPNAAKARVFVLGPPCQTTSLRDLDPQGSEQFHRLSLSHSSPGNFFAAAAQCNDETAPVRSPFLCRYHVCKRDACSDREYGAFFTDYYGEESHPPRFARERNPAISPDATLPLDAEEIPEGRGPDEIRDNAAWRRIDNEWLYSAEQLALDMNDFTNNASLVLAFELGRGGKVLLFAADAQRGNWVSWAEKEWLDGAESVSARDLLARTVLYKVGHHGSHNATLNGAVEDVYPNLSWMGLKNSGNEFTAMITAVRAWAETQKGWDHPLASIKEALLEKASGRVFQTDTPFAQMKPAGTGADRDWNDFKSRTREHRLFFDYEIRE